ncbi:von Willebrand factor type A domain protein [Yersinia pseudotuberculosis]|uniref:vWA domain-containing protein n=1 Tax=Yersinia pseudotuberculosis TaxID=633 RepID=UPI00059B5247|nr:VWA domain-containing protein [Yersinia pseudotuberculosis]AJJ04365.1 von Willebrand factor type A domain protein [Yersinia pseudotuberculosis]AJJ66275.1 von Willebrand factor type A domain protein [Yersinia pseudotuberculosis PB1/+]AYX16831.1 VWA domain-containing protein [Yersinia pseudotuberculosis]MBO1606278.1 VWA domain-containing protein [Yersinia pseudotuberculosis]MBO1610430.1 VWA domain-containing protein [Yersinia pseudotuberculosis]
MRRLPVYLLIDTSGSMRGESIHAVNVGIQAMMSALRQDPYALESVHLSIITYDNQAREYIPLTALENFQFTDITVPSAGGTFTGAALECLIHCVERDIQRSDGDQKGDWRPLVFLMTDGTPSDVYAYGEAIKEVKKRAFGSIIACAVGAKAKHEHLKQLTSQVVALETLDSTAFSGFFKWVSASVAAGSSSAGINTGQDNLPPPPPEIQLVL